MNENQNNNDKQQKGLSDDEIEMLRSGLTGSSGAGHYDNSPRAQTVRYIKQNKLFSASIAIAAVLLVVVLVFVTVFFIGKIGDRPNTSDYTVYLGNEQYTVKYKDAVKDGVVLIDMRRVATFSSLSVGGSDTNVKFSASDTQYLGFTNESEVAVINGKSVVMERKAEVSAEKCLIPLNFLINAREEGLLIKHDTENNIIKIGRRVYKDKNGDLIPTDMLFSVGKFAVLKDQGNIVGSHEYKYTTDVSEYLDSIAPKDKEKYLLLVNKSNPIGADYEPDDLVELECRTSRYMELRRDAANALYAMLHEMESEAPDAYEELFVTSAYRSYTYQVGLYDGYVDDYINSGMSREEAEEEASKTSARPGESEHQSGLCVDFMTDGMRELDESFENYEAFDWLSENAYKFGFILRYPEDKVSITKYSYEPWHYRFVGRETATEIYLSGLCLEEYLENR